AGEEHIVDNEFESDKNNKRVTKKYGENALKEQENVMLLRPVEEQKSKSMDMRPHLQFLEQRLILPQTAYVNPLGVVGFADRLLSEETCLPIALGRDQIVSYFLPSEQSQYQLDGGLF
ncbi:unnamed protein product, partial [Protopolystoma xenopodis]